MTLKLWDYLKQLERTPEPDSMNSGEEVRALDTAMKDAKTAMVHYCSIISILNMGVTSGKVLDIGTGTARIPIRIAEIAKKSGLDLYITGIDLSAEMLRRAHTNVKEKGFGDRIKLQMANAESLPFRDGLFDLVYCLNTFHHFANPLRVLSEMERVVRKDGAIFVRDIIRPPNKAALELFYVGILGRNYNPKLKDSFRDSLNAAYRTKDLKELIRHAGMQGYSYHRNPPSHTTVFKKAEPYQRKELVEIPPMKGPLPVLLKRLYITR